MGFVQSVKQAFFPEIVMMKEVLNTVVKSSWSNAWVHDKFFKMGDETVKNPYSQVGSVYKAIKAISDCASQVDYVLKNYNTEAEVNDRNLEDLLEMPNPLMSWVDFTQAVIGFFALYDEFFIVMDYGITRNPKTLPLFLHTYNPKHFREEFEHNGNLKKLIGWKYLPTQHVFPLDQIIHVKGFNPENPFRGLAPTDVIKNEIDISYQTLIFNKAFFKNGATPSLALSTPNILSDEQRKQLKEWIDTNYKGATEAFKTIVLQNGLKAENLTHTHTEMEFIEQGKQMETAMLGIWRVPKSLFSITDDINYATSREQSRIFWEDTLLTYVNKYIWALNNYLVKPYKPEIYIDKDLSNVPAFKSVFAEKVETALKLKTLGIPLNDINEKLQLGFQKYTWGDTVFVSFSDTPIEQVLEPKEPAQIDEEEKPKAITMPETKTVEKAPKNSRETFLKLHEYMEKRMESKISRFYNEQRGRVLAVYSKGITNMTTKSDREGIDWDDEDKALYNSMFPLISGGVRAGVAYAELFGIQARNLDSLKAKISSIVAIQSQKITRINHTVKDQLEKRISKIIDDAVKNGLTATQTQEALMRGVKDIYNLTAKRALMIARTETTNAMNGGAMAFYDEAGIQYKEWQSADDQNVRDSHAHCDGEVVSMSAKFSNGLRWPGDPSAPAKETINCRCSAAPKVTK